MAFDVTDVIVAIAVVVGLIAWYRTSRRGLSERERQVRLLKSNGLAFLVLCIGLWLFLPSTPSLGTFGYPNSVTDISSQDQLLRYLQEYNRAIIRLSKSLHWLLFAGVWWVGVVLWLLMKAVHGGASGRNSTAVDEPA